MSRRYVPILKGRQGELSAVGWLAPDTWRSLLPLVEFLVPPPDLEGDVDPRAAIDALHKTAAKVGSSCTGQRVIVDVVGIPPEIDLDGGAGALQVACRSLREEQLVESVPAVHLAAGERTVSDVRSLHASFGMGSCVRLSIDDVGEDPDDVDDALTTLLARLGLRRADCDLLIDLGAVDAALVKPLALATRLLIRSLADISEWRSLVVASGAFPTDLSSVTAWEAKELQRHDADLWLEVLKRNVPREPDYGDYAVSHPALAMGQAFSPPPQLRYTAAGHWLVLKGTKRDPRSNEQFWDICDVISRDEDFAGSDLGPADARIADARSDGPGNAATWRKVGTAHHLDFVARRLTTLGEP